MKISISILLLFVFFYQINAQKKAEAEQLVTEGIKFHDKGDYQAAISLYDRALALDKDNLYALGEKAFSLLMIGNQDECITCCKKAIKVHKGSDRLNNVYVCYGNALDEKGEAEKALKVYDDGIKQFPEFYSFILTRELPIQE
ncbi:MAG: tetratricopeptide repeat protein [Bacteroidales bacterium]